MAMEGELWLNSFASTLRWSKMAARPTLYTSAQGRELTAVGKAGLSFIRLAKASRCCVQDKRHHSPAVPRSSTGPMDWSQFISKGRWPAQKADCYTTPSWLSPALPTNRRHYPGERFRVSPGFVLGVWAKAGWNGCRIVIWVSFRLLAAFPGTPWMLCEPS